MNEYENMTKEELLTRCLFLEEVVEERNEQIEKMKPYCKCLCKNYSKFSAMGNDCVNGVCRNCNKWELIE